MTRAHGPGEGGAGSSSSACSSSSPRAPARRGRDAEALAREHGTPLLRLLRRLGPPGDPMAIGLDACSPGEVQHALAPRPLARHLL